MTHKTKTAEQDPAAFAKLQDLVRDIDIAMMTSVTPDGALRSRPMATREFTDDGEIWFLTSDNSSKVGDLAEEHAVNLSYADPKDHRYVSVTGNATVIRDRDRAEELWDDDVARWFSGGLDDPHLALVCVRIESAEFWDAKANRMVPLLRGARATEAADSDDGENVKVDIRATPAAG